MPEKAAQQKPGPVRSEPGQRVWWTG